MKSWEHDTLQRDTPTHRGVWERPIVGLDPREFQYPKNAVGEVAEILNREAARAMREYRASRPAAERDERRLVSGTSVSGQFLRD